MGNMRFKVGDCVRIKSIDWYNENKDEDGYVDAGRFFFDKEMSKYCGEILTITAVLKESYSTNDMYGADWTDEMIEGLAKEEKPLYKALVDKDGYMTGEFVRLKETKQEITCPDGYVFKDENGNVINATKIILEKKKKEYPKTYEECCKVLGYLCVDLCFNADYTSFNASKDQWKRLGLINQFYQLLICRDAYWKIAGEEMGLGKPWEPDYDGTFEDGTPIKYVIYNNGTCIVKGRKSSPNHILAFPTEEMRDAFYENFKEEIEICKELL